MFSYGTTPFCRALFARRFRRVAERADLCYNAERNPEKKTSGVSDMQEDVLNGLTREELMELVRMFGKNLVAMDGVWFQSVERAAGMDAAMAHDRAIWAQFSRIEARRIKQFLKLPENSGLQGLRRALPLRYNAVVNADELRMEGESLVYRVVDCRVQTARRRKGMALHPCRSAGIVEYASFAAEIDSRIRCACESCYPEVSDETCCCAWRFTLAEDTP